MKAERYILRGVLTFDFCYSVSYQAFNMNWNVTVLKINYEKIWRNECLLYNFVIANSKKVCKT